MPLDKAAIDSLKIIDNSSADKFREVGYDLTVGEIFVPKNGWFSKKKQKILGGGIVGDFEIPPQGVVVVFSKETIDMPKNVCGYAMPKTSLCSDGILVFNTGIVDPEYRGPLSATTVNFSDAPFLMKVGDPFLRLTFEEITPMSGSLPERAVTEYTKGEKEAYINQKIRSALDFSGNFLNVPKTVQAVSAEVLQKERNLLLWLIGSFTLVLTLLTVVPAFIPKDYLPNMPTKDQIEMLAKEYADRKELQKSIDGLNGELKTLKDELKTARSHIDQLANPQKSPANPAAPKTP